MSVYPEEINELGKIRTSTNLLRVILDRKYKKADLDKWMKNKFQYLTETQCNEFLKLLQNFEILLDGTIGT